MAALLPVEDALAAILSNVEPGESETVSLADAFGRILAEDLVASRTQPPFETTAMDGYAVRMADVSMVPCDLKVIGVSAAGNRYDGELGIGEVVRIFTGAPLPEGADAIVIQENTETDGTSVTILQAPKSDQFIRPRGLDFAKGDILLEKGSRMTPASIALAASANHPTLPCFKCPKVALISTGDELVVPGADPGPDQIVSSNAYGVGAQISRFGGEVLDLGIIADRLPPLVAALRQAEEAGADIIVTLGGASVGDHDLVGPAMAEIGVAVDFWRIAMRPGKPLMFGRKSIDGKILRYFGLPGNPVSSLVCSAIFIHPLVQTMQGSKTEQRPMVTTLAHDLPKNDQRQEYMRAIVEPAETGGYVANVFSKQDSSMVWNAARANALVIRPPFAPAIRTGASCPFLWFD